MWIKGKKGITPTVWVTMAPRCYMVCIDWDPFKGCGPTNIYKQEQITAPLHAVLPSKKINLTTTDQRHAFNTFIRDLNLHPSETIQPWTCLSGSQRPSSLWGCSILWWIDTWLSLNLFSRKRDYLVYDRLPSSSTINVFQGQRTWIKQPRWVLNRVRFVGT